jgi:hypothetical protein
MPGLDPGILRRWIEMRVEPAHDDTGHAGRRAFSQNSLAGEGDFP